MNYSLMMFIEEIFNIIVYGSVLSIVVSLICIVFPLKLLKTLAEYICIIFLILWLFMGILCILTFAFNRDYNTSINILKEGLKVLEITN
ncbi:MAG: hypothetical protein KID00_13470 [Clostridium argentinense]|uniref:Uncharacterized protein n=1 Tax=Clostridium faecium TaxID=2762223 RepID=A0ABR8YX70_9CLOT|nr:MULTISPECIES: hypothetical protein [Clostridium]MBD8048845.1 hypothetical protein [Clostridium faecium]MBS5824834.1 hypothetical protein [Clostridium argentinense]MDU1349221.1 hypothetical protein [Clostridium argentinense]